MTVEFFGSKTNKDGSSEYRMAVDNSEVYGYQRSEGTTYESVGLSSDYVSDVKPMLDSCMFLYDLIAENDSKRDRSNYPVKFSNCNIRNLNSVISKLNKHPENRTRLATW